MEDGLSTRLTISYDASSKSYTIAAPHSPQVFMDEDRVSDGPHSETRYRRQEGSVTDSLSLTKAGDSGAFSYRYVGAGIQRRTNLANGIENHRVNAFTYGIRTAAPAIPVVGTGSFAIAVTGVEATDFGLLDFGGTGLLSVDFAAHTLTGSGIRTKRLPTGNGFYVLTPEKFTLEGRLAYGANAFLATMNAGSGFSSIAVDGALYGPAGEEIGGAFSGLNSRNQMIAGALVGRKGDVVPQYETLATLLSPVALQAYSAGINYAANTESSDFSDVAIQGMVQSEFRIGLEPRSYQYIQDLNDDNRVDAQSDLRFTTFQPLPDRTYRIYNSGRGNDELVLTYTGFGLYELREPGFRWADEAFVFGLETALSQLPRNGTGSYRGVLYGNAVGSGSNADRFALKGTAAFDFDFSNGTFTGSLNPTATNVRTQVATDLGALPFVDGRMPNAALMQRQFTAGISGVAGTTGRLNGFFFGPQGEEVGGVFSLTTPAAGTVLVGSGAVVATQR